MKRKLAFGVTLFSIALLACESTPNYAPISDHGTSESTKSGEHVVSRGETLYSVAWRYGVDFKALASANNIAKPYTIFPGQHLRLSDVSSQSTAIKSTRPKSPSNIKEEVIPLPKVASPASSVSVPRDKKAPERRVSSRPVKVVEFRTEKGWQWPASGLVSRRFSRGSRPHKGIDIAGVMGQAVHASRGGVVVYSGNGLVGYGQLIIIKHDDTYLSAYAHNSKRLVSEGDKIKQGQRIAEMGNTSTDSVKLHFEMRKNGTPVSPSRYLPKKSK